MIKGQSKFGAELDSLADFVNFGVAPRLDAFISGSYTNSTTGGLGLPRWFFCDQRAD